MHRRFLDSAIQVRNDRESHEREVRNVLTAWLTSGISSDETLFGRLTDLSREVSFGIDKTSLDSLGGDLIHSIGTIANYVEDNMSCRCLPKGDKTFRFILLPFWFKVAKFFATVGSPLHSLKDIKLPPFQENIDSSISAVRLVAMGLKAAGIVCDIDLIINLFSDIEELLDACSEHIVLSFILTCIWASLREDLSEFGRMNFVFTKPDPTPDIISGEIDWSQVKEISNILISKIDCISEFLGKWEIGNDLTRGLIKSDLIKSRETGRIITDQSLPRSIYGQIGMEALLDNKAKEVMRCIYISNHLLELSFLQVNGKRVGRVSPNEWAAKLIENPGTLGPTLPTSTRYRTFRYLLGPQQICFKYCFGGINCGEDCQKQIHYLECVDVKKHRVGSIDRESFLKFQCYSVWGKKDDMGLWDSARVIERYSAELQNCHSNPELFAGPVVYPNIPSIPAPVPALPAIPVVITPGGSSSKAPSPPANPISDAATQKNDTIPENSNTNMRGMSKSTAEKDAILLKWIEDNASVRGANNNLPFHGVTDVVSYVRENMDKHLTKWFLALPEGTDKKKQRHLRGRIMMYLNDPNNNVETCFPPGFLKESDRSVDARKYLFRVVNGKRPIAEDETFLKQLFWILRCERVVVPDKDSALKDIPKKKKVKKGDGKRQSQERNETPREPKKPKLDKDDPNYWAWRDKNDHNKGWDYPNQRENNDRDGDGSNWDK